MQEESPEPPAPELERAVACVRGVRGAKVEARHGRIETIRVLVVPERMDERTERLIRATAAKSLGEIDLPKIDMLSAADGSLEVGARRRLSSLIVERSGASFKARVALELGGDVLVGESSSSHSRRLELEAVARSVVGAAHELLDENLEIESAEMVEVGGRRVAVVLLTGRSVTLTGAATVDADDYEAIARATLDALNRRLGAPS